MKFKAEAQQLWDDLVPYDGPAVTVQGELIRVVERLRYEAKTNANLNWSPLDYQRFCDFLEQALAVSPPFDEAAIAEIREDIAELRDFEHPYFEDDLYERLADRVVEFHHFLGRLVPLSPEYAT